MFLFKKKKVSSLYAKKPQAHTDTLVSDLLSRVKQAKAATKKLHQNKFFKLCISESQRIDNEAK